MRKSFNSLSICLLFIVLTMLFQTNVFAQLEWTSPTTSAGNTWFWSTWKTDNSEYRLIRKSGDKFEVMHSGYSTTPEFTYTLTAEEISALYTGLSPLSVMGTIRALDLTGDNVPEYMLYAQFSEPYRTSLKIMDLVTGTVILDLNEDGISYASYVMAGDFDNDGKIELSIGKTNNSTSEYNILVYSTGVQVPTGVAIGSMVPKTFSLNQNYPNPFNPSTKISFDLPKVSDVNLTIFDVSGRVVKKLVKTMMSSGKHEIMWNGTNDVGQLVASGNYFYTLQVDGRQITRRMILLK
ncbi:FlgD immunoglobulin-like domain containing protein [candidate division KSB1 bacterium]